MRPDDPAPPPESTAIPRAVPDVPLQPDGERSFGSRLWMLALTAAIVSGLGAWRAGEWAQIYFQPSADLSMQKQRSQMADSVELRKRARAAEIQMATTSFGILGAALGLTMGLAGGLARRSIGMGLLAGLIGLFLGAAAGAGLPRVMVPFYEQSKVVAAKADSTADIFRPLLIHGVPLTAIGLAAGLAMGLGSGRVVGGLVGSLLGGLLGTVIAEEIGGLAFPLSDKLRLVADSESTRLLPLICLSLAVAVCSTLAIQQLKAAPARSPDTPG